MVIQIEISKKKKKKSAKINPVFTQDYFVGKFMSSEGSMGTLVYQREGVMTLSFFQSIIYTSLIQYYKSLRGKAGL